MATQLGKTIALTTANMTLRGAGLIISLEALALLAFADEPTALPKPNGNANFILGIIHEAGSSATVSIASGYDALNMDDQPTPQPDPQHSAFQIPNDGRPVNAGAYERRGSPARQHHIVVTGSPPTGTQLRATIGVG